MNQLKTQSKKVLIGTVGGLVTLIGLILIPYPGPGWLIVFSGLAILSTEFVFAARVLEYAKGKYNAWLAWLKSQNLFVKIAALSFTGAVVVITLWLLNIFGSVVKFFDLMYPYTLLVSPLFR